MIEVGRLCFKIAGREAGKPCLIIDLIDDNYVLIDGLVRRKKCNVAHLEFTPIIFKIKKKASTKEVQQTLLDNKIISLIPKKGEKPKNKDKIKPVKKKKVKNSKKEKKNKKATKKKGTKKKSSKKKVEKKKATKKKGTKKKSSKKKAKTKKITKKKEKKK